MSKYRIDFSIRELDVPEDHARGVRFGDDVDAENVRDFFDRCRDAVSALFGTRPAKLARRGTPIFTPEEHQALQEELTRERAASHRSSLDEVFSSLMDGD